MTEEIPTVAELRPDALAWAASILDTCKDAYQCKFYAHQYVKIFNSITNAD